MRVSSNKLLQKYEHPPSHDVVTLLSAQNLSDSNFPEAAYYTSRVIFKGHVTIDEMVFNLKHHWSSVNFQPLELYGLS
jgi:hypothetical protein